MPVVSRRPELLDALHTTVSAVSPANGESLGPVLRGRHRLRDMATIEEIFTDFYDDENDKRRLRGWEVYWAGASDLRGGRDAGIGLGKILRRHIFRVDGYMGYDEDLGTEDRFNLLVDAVIDELADTFKFSEITTTLVVDPPECETDIEVFGDYVVHVARISVTIQEHITRT